MKLSALLIGITDYPFHPLKGCVHDTILMRMLLEKNDYLCKSLINKDATKKSITSELKKMAYSSSKDDRFFIYFSSHGTKISDKNDEEEDGLDECLVCYYEKMSEFGMSLLSDDELAIIFDLFHPDSLITFVVDACHSGTMDKVFTPRFTMANNKFIPPPADVKIIRKNIFRRIYDYIFPPKVYVLVDNKRVNILLAACQENELAADAFFSYSPVTKGTSYHGVMTYFFYHACIKNGSYLSLADLLSFLRENISNRRAQRPVISLSPKIKETDDILFRERKTIV